MNIAELFNRERKVFSFEIFPPKQDSGIDTVYTAIEALGDLSPDYISVTYGAGGSRGENRTVELSDTVRRRLKIEPLAHLSCISQTREQVDAVLEELKEKRINNVLALRGDPPADGSGIPEEKRDFRHASDLVAHIKAAGDFHVAAACYPEKHLEAPDMETDILHLKEKVDAGADWLITQLFFDNESFFRFSEKAAAAGINVPIEAGIMPVTSKKQIFRMVNMCGAAIPEKLMKLIDKYGEDRQSMRDAGIIYAAQQISELLAGGAAGIHLYTMNDPAVARRISLITERLFRG